MAIRNLFACSRTVRHLKLALARDTRTGLAITWLWSRAAASVDVCFHPSRGLLGCAKEGKRSRGR